MRSDFSEPQSQWSSQTSADQKLFFLQRSEKKFFFANKSRREQKMVQFFNNCPRSWFDFENFCVLAEASSAFSLLACASALVVLAFLDYNNISLLFAHTVAVLCVFGCSSEGRCCCANSGCVCIPSSSRSLSFCAFVLGSSSAPMFWRRL